MASGSEWQMARQWLIDAGVIPPYHRATKPTADLVDFSNCLRDGSFLCDLCNRIKPNAIRQIHSRPQRQFLCMQNINAFLSCCNREFGMESSSLFETTDLYEVSDFGAVVRTLSTLSKTRQSLAAGLQYVNVICLFISQ
jgi:guanine nucleotide exchange factor VAV